MLDSRYFWIRRVVLVPKNRKLDRLDPVQICLDSSRGPTAEQHMTMKLDVVAPGFNIFAAHSRHPRPQPLQVVGTT